MHRGHSLILRFHRHEGVTSGESGLLPGKFLHEFKFRMPLDLNGEWVLAKNKNMDKYFSELGKVIQF